MSQSSMDMMLGRNDTSGWLPTPPPSLDGVDVVDFDTETTGLKWWDGDLPIGLGVGFWRDGRYHKQYLPWGHRGGNLDQDRVKEWALRELAGKTLAGLNIKFDAHMFYKWGVDLEDLGCTLTDVGHWAALIDDQRSKFSLEHLSQDYLGRGKVTKVTDGTMIDTSRMRSYYAGEVRLYAEEDVQLVAMLRDKLGPVIVEQQLERVLALENRVIYPTLEMERNGFRINEQLLRTWVWETEVEIDKCARQILSGTGLKVDFGTADDMAKLFVARGFRDFLTTPSGLPVLADEALAGMKDEYVQLARRGRKIKSLRSKLEKYARSLEPGAIIRYQLNQLKDNQGGTLTGRFSSCAFRGPGFEHGINIQQVMSAEKQEDSDDVDQWIMRKLFLPAVGKKLVAGDAKQIEYRVFAHYANSKQLNEAYANDPETDYHAVVGTMIEPYRPGLIRKYVKNVNFCKLFGGGPKKIAGMLDISEDEAKELVGIYDRAFPEVNVMLNGAMSAAKKRGHVHTFMGRRTRFACSCGKGSTGKHQPYCVMARIYKALNGVVQGGATGDIMKIKTVELHESCKEIGFTLRATVHDEVVLDVDSEAQVHAVSDLLNDQAILVKNFAEGGHDLKIPILWDVEVGDNWGDVKKGKLAGSRMDYSEFFGDRSRGGRSGA